MKNKKKIIMVAVAAALLIGVSGVGIAAALNTGSEPVKTAQNSQKAKTTELNKKKDVKTAAKAKLTKTASETKTPTPEKSDGNKKSDQVTQPAHQEQTKQNNANSGNTGNHVQKPSPTDPEPQRPADPEPQPQHTAAPESAKPSHTHDFSIPVYGTETEYVVDLPAWTEIVNDPIYEMVEICVCDSCGTDITASVEQHMLEYGHGWHSEWKQVQTGTNTYPVEHPEVGHNETKQTITGYKCSCGAVQ